MTSPSLCCFTIETLLLSLSLSVTSEKLFWSPLQLRVTLTDHHHDLHGIPLKLRSRSGETPSQLPLSSTAWKQRASGLFAQAGFVLGPESGPLEVSIGPSVSPGLDLGGVREVPQVTDAAKSGDTGLRDHASGTRTSGWFS